MNPKASTSLVFWMMALASCGDSAALLRPVDGGRAGDGGGPDAVGSGADADAQPVQPRACGELPERDLHSIDEVKAALLASPAFPFPAGWQPCRRNIEICPPAAPYLSFDKELTTMKCGQNSERGFYSTLTFPMTIVDSGQKTATGTPIYQLEIQGDGGVNHFDVAALGQLGGPVGIKLLQNDLSSPYWAVFEPLASLP